MNSHLMYGAHDHQSLRRGGGGGNIVDRFNVALKEIWELAEIQDYIQD